MKKLVLLLVLSFGAIGRAIAAPADGTWEVRLTGDTGFRCSGDYIIRLTVAQVGYRVSSWVQGVLSRFLILF
jgi:hypothetical protein